jgi:hypothetical protein
MLKSFVVPSLQELRLRMVVHSGTDAKIVESLKPFGLSSGSIGSVVGGDFTQTDFLKWLQNQNRLESGRSTDPSRSQ